MPSFLRSASFAVALLTVSATARGQGVAPPGASIGFADPVHLAILLSQFGVARAEQERMQVVGTRAGEVYISGDVRVGGPVEIISGETLTLTKAILKAGGIGEWGDMNRVSVTRLKADGAVEKMSFSLRRILKSGDVTLDPVLQDGDRIFVPRMRIGF